MVRRQEPPLLTAAPQFGKSEPLTFCEQLKTSIHLKEYLSCSSLLETRTKHKDKKQTKIM